VREGRKFCGYLKEVEDRKTTRDGNRRVIFGNLLLSLHCLLVVVSLCVSGKVFLVIWSTHMVEQIDY